MNEAQDAHSKPGFIAKLQIALKEANETGYWLELLWRTGYIDEAQHKQLSAVCTGLRVMLISSIRTAKGEVSSMSDWKQDRIGAAVRGENPMVMAACKPIRIHDSTLMNADH